MHPTSIAIKAIIDATPGYTLQTLLDDLGSKSVAGPALTSKQAAARLNCSVRTIFYMIETNRLKTIHPTGSRRTLRFREADIAALEVSQ